MAKYTTPFLLLSLSLLLLLAGSVSSCRRCSRARAFVIISCRTTLYPKVCENSLSRYVNSTNLSHKHLAQIALRVSITEARFTRAYLTKMARRLRRVHYEEAQAIGDCIDQINDSVFQLRLSLRELQRCSDQITYDNFSWYTSNVETWTSTALTDQINCAAAFEGNVHGKIVRSRVRAKVDGVTQVTSNALALVNRFIMRHRFTRAKTHLRP
ncbi:pectinesterase inhibitor 11-like [Beta vulgaris subsp. vulgaris]|uniref:pectinesterase inhibitor 11-like n=1 Tax=Beta vulgaris subsp. vulgaris TaxID=3555 RepID=UPI00254724E7|nr:pectinesterase inhibitor 11-like [Beta vulgaris subsp. vulgaris]